MEKIRSLDEWNRQYNNKECREWERVITSMVRKNNNKRILFPGYCQICEEEVDFDLNDNYSGELLNFRESLACPICHLNNRQRALISLIKSVYSTDVYIYIYMNR